MSRAAPAARPEWTPCGGVEVRVALRQDRRGGAARRQARHVDAARVDGKIAHHVARQAGDQRGFAAVAELPGGVEPVPAFLGVGRLGLARVDHEEPLLLGQIVHPRPGGEVLGRLRAAVQHHDERHRFGVGAARHVEPVVERARGALMGELGEAGALRHRDLGRRAAARPHPAKRRGGFQLGQAAQHVVQSRRQPVAAEGRQVAERRHAGQLRPEGVERRKLGEAGEIESGRLHGAGPSGVEDRSPRSAGHVVGGHVVRSARAALTAAAAWRAPSTWTELMAARASSGVTSGAMVARPSTWMSSVSPAATTASRSRLV